MTGPDLDLYDVAYLAGGAGRVVDTAVIVLVESGRIRVHAPGQLAVVDHARRNPVEGAVLDAVGIQGHRSLDLVVWRLAGDDRIQDVGRRLTLDGLLRRRSALRRRHTGPPVRTAAGRRLLRGLVAEPPVFSVHDGGSAVQVALHGPRGMTDAGLRASIFDVPRTTIPSGTAGLRHRIETSRRNSPYDSPHNTSGGGGYVGTGI